MEVKTIMIKKNVVIFGIIGGLLAGAATWGCILINKRSNLKETTGHHAEPMRPVPTAVVQPSLDSCMRFFPGKVKANRHVELAFSVPGLLELLNAEEGRGLCQGEVVARLDQRDYQHALDAANARCDHAKREFERYRNLWDQEIASEVEYENAKTAYEIAYADLCICKKALEDTVLRVPFNGLVVRRYMENFEHVQAKQPILSFQDISVIRVVIQVPERLIAREGMDGLDEIQVHFDADSEKERWLEAFVLEYVAESDCVTRTYDVVVALPPPEDLKVFPGMTATVKANIICLSTPSPSEEDATIIPVESLWRGSDGISYVWVIDPDGGNPEKRPVKTAVLSGDCVEISGGLEPGKLVATAGLRALREDQLVRPMISGKEGLDG